MEQTTELTTLTYPASRVIFGLQHTLGDPEKETSVDECSEVRLRTQLCSLTLFVWARIHFSVWLKLSKPKSRGDLDA